MTPSDPGVYIPPSQMYQEVRALSEAVSRIESKLDGLLDETKDIRHDIADHEARLRSLETARWPLPSLAAVVSLGALGVALYTASGR
ncbi:hypothetical protein [Streptomyces thermolilacinus]|uniref:hypothetical protein n=1 Tax=Streptomyces thermolilacinus TaxID=285540 RepID=UPI0033D3987C